MMLRLLWRSSLGWLLLLVGSPFLGTAYDLDTNSMASITNIAKQMAEDMLTFYGGNKPGGTPGLLPQPYYWWEAGAMLGALIDYWYYTKDDAYNQLVTEGLLFQVGETNDYMPRNQTLTEGNDDQGFWGLAVMSAAEYNFPNPPADKPQWLALAQAVFNTQAARWDTENCGGGLRWQIFKWNTGYDYKNSISQACFFALGARLALYTGNNTYADWAEKTWDWMLKVKFISSDWKVYDGGHVGEECSDVVPYQFSYNAGGFILGAAAMYNHTEDAKWKDRLDKLLNATQMFFTGPQKNIMTEVACETVDRCNLDQQSFKAYLSRWFAAITKWAPHTYSVVMPYLRSSAVAAAKQCTGGDNGRMCGLKWSQGKYDGSSGVGQQMAAMEVVLACMIKDRGAPVTGQSGGTSQGSPGSGGNDPGRDQPSSLASSPITAGEQAGAAAATIVVLLCVLVGVVFVLLDETSSKGPVQQFKDFRSNASSSITALFGAAGAARPWHRNRAEPAEGTNEKSEASNTTATSSSRSSSDNSRTIRETPIKIGNVRNQSSDHHQPPASRMPRGWPHNPSRRERSLPQRSSS